MVFYRKYRSQTIAELDLASVRTKLTNLLKSKEMPHALLFTGPKGLGKTSSARILAKAINCEKNDLGNKKNQKITSKNQHPRTNIEPCNECQACISITNGSSMDIIEIDAASNRGIDEIRSLREKVKFAPSQLAKKVYIIDEVHMLTNEAFNALLKTLEEPPDHVMFILCTTEANKLPQTIMSRVFTIQFEKPTREEIRHALDRAVKGEELKVDEEVYDSIIMLADGAFRDAHKILEELSYASSGKHITKDIVESVYKTGTIQTHIQTLLNALKEKNAKKALGILDQLAQNGADFKMVTESLVEKLRVQMIQQIEKKDKTDFTFDELKKLIEMFNTAYKNIAFSVMPQLPLELVAVEWSVSAQKDVSEIKLEASSESEPIIKSPEISQKAHIEPEAKKEIHNSSSIPQDFLYQVIDVIKKDNQTIAGLLRSCKFTSIDENSLRLSTPFQFHRNKLQEKAVIKIIQDVSSRLLNRTVSVEVVIVS